MKQIYVVIAMLSVMPILCSCSSSEEPEAESAKQITTRLKSIFLNDKGDLDLFPLSEGRNEYVTPCDNENQAQNLCHALLEGIDRKDSENRYILPDGYGSVIVSAGESEGIYLTLIFNVKDIPSFTMHITSDDFFENINNDGRFLPMWKCTKCGRTVVMRQRPSPCCSGGSWILAGKSKIPVYA